MRKLSKRTIQILAAVCLLLFASYRPGIWALSSQPLQTGLLYGLAAALMGVELYYFWSFCRGGGTFYSNPSLLLMAVYLLMTPETGHGAAPGPYLLLLLVQWIESLFLLILCIWREPTETLRDQAGSSLSSAVISSSLGISIWICR